MVGYAAPLQHVTGHWHKACYTPCPTGQWNGRTESDPYHCDRANSLTKGHAMKGKRALRRAIRRAQKLADLTEEPHRVTCDNANGHYRITAYFPRGTRATLKKDCKPRFLDAVHHKGKFAAPKRKQFMPYYGGMYYGITVFPTAK